MQFLLSQKNKIILIGISNSNYDDIRNVLGHFDSYFCALGHPDFEAGRQQIGNKRVPAEAVEFPDSDEHCFVFYEHGNETH